MKPLNLLQNMSAEAKVLAMALPMLLLSAMSAMAKQDEGYMFPEKMDMPFIVTQPGDSASVQPVENPDKNAIWENLPSQKPQDAGLDYTISPGIPFDFMPSKFLQPVSPDSVNVEPAQQPDSDYLQRSIPNMNGGDPEEDRLINPGIPDEDDIYESYFIESIYNDQAGIEDVAVDNQPSQAAQGVFTLSGLLVSSNADLSGLAPGLYIVNGKKILVK